MVCGYGDSVSYEQLVNDLAKARVDKSSRFTDWSRRPLTDAQLTYALSDVTYLVTVYEELLQQLEKSGRLAWLSEEMAVLYLARDLSGRSRECVAPARRPPAQAERGRGADGDCVLARARGAEPGRSARPHPQGRRAGRPRRVGAAQVEALGPLALHPNGFERSRTGAEILEAVERGLARDPATVPALERSRGRGSAGAVVELLKVLLKAVAEEGRRRAEDRRHRRRTGSHRRKRHRQCAVAARLASRAFRRKGPGVQERPARPDPRSRAGRLARSHAGLISA